MRAMKAFRRRTPDHHVREAVVYYHANWQEWFVRFYIDGVYQLKMFYPADSFGDACERADYFVNRE